MLSNKLPSDKLKDGEINIELTPGDGRPCYECGNPVQSYLWSQYFCPGCDKERMDRIHKSLKQIQDDFKNRNKV